MGSKYVLDRAREKAIVYEAPIGYADPLERLKMRIKLKGTEKFRPAEDRGVYQWILYNKKLPLDEQPNDDGVREVLRKAEESRITGNPLDRLKMRIKSEGTKKFKRADDSGVYDWIQSNKDLPLKEQPNNAGVREVLRKAREESIVQGDPLERLKERIQKKGTGKFKGAEDAGVYRWILRNKDLPLEEQPNDPGVREVLRKAREKD